MQILIRECQEQTGRRGLPILFGRNPTIRIGGIMLLFVPKIKSDINDDTISISAKICSAPNLNLIEATCGNTGSVIPLIAGISQIPKAHLATA